MKQRRERSDEQQVAKRLELPENETKKPSSLIVSHRDDGVGNIKEGSNISGGGIPIPSEDTFIHRYLRIWTRRLMIVCIFFVVCCVIAVPALSRLRVKRILIEGCHYYDTNYLAEQSGVLIGEELLLCSPGEIQAELFSRCPYLLTVSVERSLRGDIYISVTERKPCFALLISPNEVALMDKEMRVLEICSFDGYEAFQDVVLIELPANAIEQAIVPGQTYENDTGAVERLLALLEAWTSYPEVLVRSLDMTDLYAVALTLQDGTIFALHDCADPQKQIYTALGALQAYRQKTGYMAPVIVDVDGLGNVFVGMPPFGEE